MKIIFTIIFLIFSNASFAKDVDLFVLNQENIAKEARNNSPTMERIMAASLGAKLNKNQYLEKFQPQLEGNASYFQTNETPIIDFVPIVSPITNLSLGVKKDFTTGVSLGVYNKFTKQNYGSFGIDARNSIALEFTMDLYKNFFGRDSKNRVSYFDYQDKIAQIRKKIDEEIFLITLNRIYFSLILNQEAINISNKILAIYKNQENDASNRYKSGVADLSEVERRSSQLASKRVDIATLSNDKENLILTLKQLLPSISANKVVLDKYNIDQKIEGFYKIAKNIEAQKTAPLQYTSYDEIVDLIDKSYEKQKRFTKNYSDADVKLYSTYEHFGRDEDVNQAIDETYKRAEDAYQVGVRVSVPLGKTKTNSRDLQLSLQNANFLANKQENLGKIQAYHTQSIHNLELLSEAKSYQAQNSKNLQKILNLSEQKFDQARIPIRDLIADQDFYLQSRLRELSIKMSIANQIFDYMEVFTNTPFSLSNG